MSGFAVIDLETTGVFCDGNDRICEIAVVLVDPRGQLEHSYTTLVNPKRDLGPQHIHRISARDARVAPTFDQIVGDVIKLVAGRTVVAHNSTFDAAFPGAEYARSGWPTELTAAATLCTMRLAKQVGPPGHAHGLLRALRRSLDRRARDPRRCRCRCRCRCHGRAPRVPHAGRAAP